MSIDQCGGLSMETGVLYLVFKYGNWCFVEKNPIFEHWSYTLFVDKLNGCGTWTPPFVGQYP